MQLSSQQQKAINHIGSPALVVAGAGSGKTRALTSKFSLLVKQGHNPKRILAITFTNKAADEMKSRLMKITDLDYNNFLWVRTYHSACLMILKQHCNVLNYETPLQVFSLYSQQKLIKELCIKNNMDIKYSKPALSFISKAKNSGNPEQYFDFHKSAISVRVKDIFKQYEERLKEMNSVDFDNILLKTRDLLKNHDAIRNYYQKYFSYILVDEYQDTNNLQEELTSLFLGKHNNLFCVGDDWQAVYGFRGSNIDHFFRFSKKYEKAKIFKLEENYRSANEIVEAANDLINYNPDRMAKKCFSKKKGGIVEIYDFISDTQEAEWTAKRIIKLSQQGIKLDEIAVIYRTKFCSLSFERIFRQYRIPYIIKGGQDFFERMEIVDINSYLNAAVFHNDDVSFERIVNTPKRGIGPKMIEKISKSRAKGQSLQDTTRTMIKDQILKLKTHEDLCLILNILDKIKDMPPAAAINFVIKETNYLKYLEKKSKTANEFIAKKENLEQLIYTAQSKADLLDYLEEAALIREDKEDNQNTNNKVSLHTIHSAKGLEYETVFIIGCEEKLFPHWRSMEEGKKAMLEERRLMYVAMTRAKRFLYLTHSAYRKGVYSIPSRFIDQIKEAL